MTELSDDVLRHREWLVSLAAIPSAGLVVDLGSGDGHDLRLMAARQASPHVRFLGIDVEEKSVDVARASTQDARITFMRANLDDPLPLADGSVGLVYSNNLVECLAVPEQLASELARVLQMDGVAVVGHWDWDSQLFDGSDKALVRRLVHAYADWQQGWMKHADGWMGRRLWRVFNTPRLRGSVHARVLSNTTYAEPWFGHANAQSLAALVRRGMAEPEDLDAFLNDQATLSDAGQYFYSITGYAYVGQRTSTTQADDADRATS